MNIQVKLEENEVVEDWTKFRLVFNAAAEELGLVLDEIVHQREQT